MSRTPYLAYLSFIGIFILALSSCGSAKYNSDYNLSRAQQKKGVKAEEALASADTTLPSVENKLPAGDSLTEKRKKSKPNKRYFMGYRVKRGFVRSGQRGDNETLETFSFLPVFEEPNPYAPRKYYFDTRNRRIANAFGEIDQDRYKVLHGPYKKKIGNEVVEEGYYYVGTKHLRWERYNKNGILLDKAHYDKGFLRDAVVKYYNNDRSKIKEVIPYAYGQVQGTYYRFYENGQVEWTGQYEKGRKVGVWIKNYDFRNRRHYEFQYPKSAYEEPFEPFLLKQYDRHGTLIYEKDKLDKRASAAQR